MKKPLLSQWKSTRFSLKFDLKMKITILLFMTTLLCLQANDGYSQKTKLTLNIENTSVKNIIDNIESTSEFRFIYKTKHVDLQRKLSLKIENKQIDFVLENLFNNTDTAYNVRGRHIILTKVKNTDVSTIIIKPENRIQEITVSGTVTDSNGAPLPGASVVEKGTSNGTQTDFDGNFSIAVSNNEAVLEISYIGFKTQQVTVGSQTQIKITLEEDAAGLDEVVVIGYGTVKKSDLTGSVVSIKSEEITKVVAPSFDTAIQGRLAGVQISSGGGQPGAETGIKIRGGNSISGSNQPLIIVDGVPINSGSASDGTVESAGINPLGSINPNDIASIEVLKDASAGAIYGARAGNGVILITTKTGSEGSPQISLNTFTGIQEVLPGFETLSASQYIERANTANPGSFTSDQIQTIYDSVGENGVNWRDELLRTALTQNVNVSVRGGTSKTKYSLSADYFNQEGVVIHTGLKRYSFRTNIDTKLSEKVNLGARLTYSKIDADVTNSGQVPGLENSGVATIQTATLRDPLTPVRDADGNFLLVSNNPNSDSQVENPVAVLEDGVSKSISNRLIGNLFMEFQIANGLTFKPSIGVDVLNRREQYYMPTTSLIGSLAGGIARLGTREDNSWINENVLSYNKEFESSYVNVVLGNAVQSFTGNFFQTAVQGFPSDLTTVNNLSAGGTVLPSTSSLDEWAITSFFGRVNYTIADKYLFTVTGRYDGSSRFGANNKWAFFPSAALGWKIHEENFLKESAVSQFKLRASYGRTGNQDIPPFRSLSTLGTQVLNTNGTQSTTFYVDRIANPDLKWETTDQFNVGIDFGLFKQRLSIVADYYHKETRDLLLERALPSSAGFRSSLQNIGAIKNSGVELGITSINVANKGDFGWTTNLNLSRNRSEVLDLGNDVEELIVGFSDNLTKEQIGILRVGEQLGSFYGRVYEGLYEEDQLNESGDVVNSAGTPIFKDLDGDGDVDGEDRTIIGTAEPDLIYGLNNNFTYKNFDLSVFIQGTLGNDIYNATLIDSRGALVDYWENRWTVDNKNDRYPRIAPNLTGANLNTANSYFIEDGSYLRLKNITLGYSLSTKAVEKIRLSNLRFYLSVDNISTITNYTGLNPDVSGRPNDNFNTGLDDWTYPAGRNFRFGLNATF